MWNTFDVNVLVNGNRCKQYNHDGRTYIEAKDGSEWYFQIQNNSPGRVLAVCSVDGLNVLTGETAKPDDTGYIIDAYHSQKIKGFRFSDDEWALFKFGYKVNKSTGAKNEKVYAVSKGGSAEKNCGVIGVKLFYEVAKVVEYVPPQYYNYTHSGSCSWATGSCAVNANYTISGAMDGQVNWSPGGLYGEGRFGYTPDDPIDIKYRSLFGGCSAKTPTDLSLNDMVEDHYIPVRDDLKQAIADAKSVRMTALAKPKGFDMGTEWGKKEKSKVEVIDFERGCEAFNTDIYYASRESLIEMGVPLSNNIKIGLPQSFPNKYCRPPTGWVGLL
jgi:hypothetical protein